MHNYPQNQRFDKPSSREVVKKSNHGSGLVPHRALLWCGAQKFIGWVLDTVFPRVCLGCRQFTGAKDFHYLCRKCFGKIEIKNTLECVGCKRQTQLGLTCISCKKENHLDQLVVAAELSDRTVDKMIKTYKYKFIQEISLPLSVIAGRCLKKLGSKGFNIFEDSPLLIPVPLHKKRLNWRGFNQAGLIARNLSDIFLMTYNENALARIINSKHQADIKIREERLKNIKGSFAVTDREAIKGRTIILVDDICTTGATLNECAKVLKENGAGRVIGFVIARG